MTQHREIDQGSPESGSTPGGLSASFVDLMKERTKGGDKMIAHNGDFLSFNGDQAVSARYGGTDFLSNPPKSGIDHTAFLSPQIKVGTAFRTDGKALLT